jgi:hypothetical protein
MVMDDVAGVESPMVVRSKVKKRLITLHIMYLLKNLAEAQTVYTKATSNIRTALEREIGYLLEQGTLVVCGEFGT